MLSATSDHAIRAVLLLARHDGNRRLSAEEIADAIGAPRNYLSKTLNSLAKLGLVTSSRGPNGGFLLAVSPADLTLARIVDCFEEPPRSAQKCLLGTSSCDLLRPCAAHHRWTGIKEARRAPLSVTTIADLLDKKSSAAPVYTPQSLHAGMKL